MNTVNISLEASVFQAKVIPEKGKIVGYTALISHYGLGMPYPTIFSVITNGNKKYKNKDWQVFPAVYQPEETVYKQLQFAIKNEGINLLFFKKLFQKLDTKEITNWIQNEPSSIYSRKIWFLYEFLMQIPLQVADADKKIKFTNLLDDSQQFALSSGIKSSRHRIINNLPGTVDFCPLIFKTDKLIQYIAQDLSAKNNLQLNRIHKDILLRTSAFLLLKDSKASFRIEGETPLPSRAMRWGKAIGEAGRNELSKAELERLQQIVIESAKFIKFGYRQQDGFVGEHDRDTFQPLPDHISAKYQDIDALMNGLLQTTKQHSVAQYHPVLAAATIAFGFVFIHPFVDGNGRLHRYIIHHILAKNNFTPQGIIFPISASILNHIVDYRRILEQYSHTILPFIEWKATADNNVSVTNETADFYKYYDATSQAEFLFDCINDTIENSIPQEVKYLQQYDEFKNFMDNEFEMPDKMVALMVKLLSQNEGVLSKKKREVDFKDITDSDLKNIELAYKNSFDS
jgi:Fic family protein